MTQHFVKRALLAVFAAAVLVPATISAQDATEACPGSINGDLVVALNNDLFSTDPLMGGTIAAVNYNMALSDPLVIMGDVGPSPWLIESWEATPEGVYTWNLRQGVNFHDGTPFNAEALVYNIERLRNPDNEYRYGSYFARTTALNVIDEYTLEVVNESFDVEFMDRMINITPGSPTAYETLGEDFITAPVGTGPFRFVSYTAGERAVLERNPDYWQAGKPCLNSITFRFIPEEAVRLIELEAGTVHVAMDMAASAIQAQSAGLELITTPPRGQQMVYFNLSRITDPLVRQAVNHAINRQAIVTNVYQDMSVVGFYPMPPSVWAFNDTTQVYDYDVTLANELLDQAGWVMGPDGIREKDGQQLVWSMPTSNIPSRQQASEMVAGMLSEIGIGIEMQGMDQLTFIDTVRAGNYDIAWYEWAGSTSDPWAYSGGLHSEYAFNVTQFGDPTLDSLLDQALVIQDREARQALYDEYFSIVMENAYVASVAFKPEVTVIRPEVEGVQFPGGRLLFESVTLNT
jgi:peptide/nickel transport system substrate-binding protein